MVNNADLTPFRFRLQKEFIKDIMTKLNKKSSQLNAAVVVYSHQTTVQLNFTQPFKVNHFLNIIDNLPVVPHSISSTTKIYQALQVTSDLVFAKNGGSRLNTRKIAVLFLQCSQQEKFYPLSVQPTSQAIVLKTFINLSSSELQNAAESLKRQGVCLLAVCIGGNYDLYDSLRIITDSASDVVMVKDFSSLSNPVDQDEVVGAICWAISE